MADEPQYIHDKVLQIFTELVPDRAERLSFFQNQSAAVESITTAFGQDTKRAGELAFHLSDFRADAAFIVALHLFPERFTPKEVAEGVWQFLAHAPYHIEKAQEIANS